MSFSGDVKRELQQHAVGSKGIAYAELTAFFMFAAKVMITKGDTASMNIEVEHPEIAEKIMQLCVRTFSRECTWEGERLLIPTGFSLEKVDWQNPVVLEDRDKKRAFLRAAFLCVGSMSDPEKSYHLEYDCQSVEKAQLIQQLIGEFDLEAKIVERKRYQVVYLKEGTAIGDLLNIMGAHVSLMEYENKRIIKEMRNNVNRRVNCETANLAKTALAAAKQVEDIQLIAETIGFGDLPQGLSDIARLRLEFQEASLQELGGMLEPPVGKSGVNHRLRKLSQIAAQIRRQSILAESE